MGDKTTRRTLGPPDYGITLAVAALLIIGLIMVFSTTYMRDFDEPAYFLTRQLVWTALGLVVLVVLLRINYHTWQRVSVLMMIALLGMLVLMAVIGQEQFGGQRWLLGGSVQPSELAKLGLVIYVADWLASKGRQIRQVTYGLIPFSILVGLVCGLILVQRHLSSPIIIAVAALGMFFVAGADMLQMTLSALMGGGAIAVVIMQATYRRIRFISFWNPLADPLDRGFQGAQALRALKRGGLLGVGLGGSEIKFQPPPVWHSDGIFAIIGEELGLAGCLLVLALFTYLTYRGLMVARQAPDPFGRFLAVGVTTWISVQAMIHMGANVAVIPSTGVPLPFISYGGSSLITCLAGVGLLLNVSRHARQAQENSDALVDYRWRNRGPRLSGVGRN